MNTIDPKAAFDSIWYGSMQISCDGRTAQELEAAVSLLTRARTAGLLDVSKWTWRMEDAGRAVLASQVESLPGHILLMLGNLLSADSKSAAVLQVDGSHQSARIPVVPRLYDAPLPRTQVECDMDSLIDVMGNFVLQFEFGRGLDASQREEFCEGLDAWAALVNAGAFPMEESLSYPSVIGGYSSRFEDPATGGIDAEGIAASPASFGLLVHLANQWNARIGVHRMTLEHTG